MSNHFDLTICSVSFHNAIHLVLNWELTKHLNKGVGSYKWIIAENTPEGDKEGLAFDDERFQVIAGISGRHKPNYQHTEALHKCLEYVDTNFLLVLDPDFYIVKKNWIELIINHMQEKKLTFFGVPWHPKHTDKYRYFPCVHCLFVNLNKINIGDLDFRPACPDELVDEFDDKVFSKTVDRFCIRGYTTRVSNILGLQARHKRYTDTGTRLYQQYAKDHRFRHECAIPVFRLPMESPIIQSWSNRLLEKMLPDELCYLPKRNNSFTAIGMREYGYLREAPRDWEEFMWQDSPFGFHVRRNSKKSLRNAQSELKILDQVIRNF